MTPKTLAALAALPLLAAQGDIAVARAPAPLLPTALVEDVHSASAEVEFMDYVGRGQVIRLPKDLTERTLTLRRTDRPGERRTLKLDDAAAASGFHDLAKRKVSLTRGATYEAAIGGRKLSFRVDAKATSAAAPVVSRLLRFP